MEFIDYQNVDLKIVKDIVRRYNTLDYLPQLKGLLSTIYPENSLTQFKKYDLHKAVNNLIVEQHQGEQALKYQLFQEFRKKKVVAAYEIRVNKSRADFLTINGVSTSYEIKSNLDNLTKLAKQASDYLLAFEYNYLVIHERHLKAALQIVPEIYGIWTYNGDRKRIYRPAQLNTEINPEIQLMLLTKKELRTFFSGKTCTNDVMEHYCNESINTIFKKTLKARYANRWEFVVKHCLQILPIDLQFFFNTNIDPKYIYNN